jgi:DNA-binding CsgD family transcriptional regulator
MILGETILSDVESASNALSRGPAVESVITRGIVPLRQIGLGAGMSDVDLLRTIGRAYEAATDPSALNSFAEEMSRQFACDMALLYVIQQPLAKSTDLLLSATANFDDWAHSSYTGYYRQHDIWSRRMLGRRNAVMHGLELIDPSVLRKTMHFGEYCTKVGIGHVLAGTFEVKSDIGVVNLSRDSRAREFGDEDKRRLQILIPHIQRAVQIQQRLSAAEQERALTHEMLERLDLGIMILEADSRLLFANAVARRVLQSGRDLTTSQGWVRPRHTAKNPRFAKVVRDAALTSIGQGTGAGGFVPIQRPDGPPLSLLVSPYPAAPGNPGHAWGAALILFADPDAQTDVPEHALAQMFGLSPAQTRLVSALVAGETMADYADAVGITMNTAKTQMRQIFLKVGVNRQADLIRAVAANPLARLARDRTVE